MDKYEIPFFNACVKEFSKRFAMTRKAAYEYLHRYKAVAFLLEFYDVEHLQSIEETVDDLVVICKNNGGALG